MRILTANLDEYADKIRAALQQKDASREKVLPLCRELIRYASITIRAVHRQEFDEAKKLIIQGRKVREALEEAVSACEELRYHGFVRDAQKEYTEANTVLALVTGEPIPDPDELNVDYAAYLNGLGDTVGELRRYILDNMRQGDLSKCEEILTVMDEIYTILVTMDFPDAITGGLRHTTDQVRGILEKTRGDITLAVRQQALERKLNEFQRE
jgi:translin